MSTLLESDYELGFSFSREGRWLFAKTFDDTIHIWDVASGSELRTLENVDEMTLSPNETLLAVVSWSDEKVKLLDMTTGSDVHTFDMRDVNKVVFSQDGTLLASVSAEQIKFWDVASGSEVRMLNIGYQDGLLFSPEGTLMISDVRNDEGNQFMKVWDIANGVPMCDLKSNDTITEFVFSPDGKLLATATRDGIVTLWDVSRP